MRPNIIWILTPILLCLSGCSRKPTDGITAAGIVDGEVITIKAVVTGKVENLNLQEGAEVFKGDILAEINPEKLENQIQGLEIQEKEIRVSRKKLLRKIQLLQETRTYWKEQVESFERLQKKESVSEDQLEKARLKLEEVEASLFEADQTLRSFSIQSESIQNQREHLNLLLEDHMITSPVSGVVLEKFISEGETIFPGSSVADILDRSSLYVETFLEGQEISRLKLGQPVDILVDGMEERVFSGTVSYFGQKAEFSPKYVISEKERRSLLYRVKIKIEGELEVFKIGMPVTVRAGK